MDRSEQLLSLDRKIASSLFNKKPCTSYLLSPYPGGVHVVHSMVDGCSPDCILNINNSWPPPYSSDISVAWELVEKYQLSILRSDNGWIIESKEMGISMERESVPLAISLVSWLIHSAAEK